MIFDYPEDLDDICPEDCSYKDLIEYKIDLTDRIYEKYYWREIHRDNHNKLSDDFKNYLMKYEEIIKQLELMDKELDDYLRIMKNDTDPYHYFYPNNTQE